MDVLFFLTLTKLVPDSGLTKPGDPVSPQLVKIKDQQYKPSPMNIVLTGIQVEALMSVVNQVAAKMEQAVASAELKRAIQPEPNGEGVQEPPIDFPQGES